MDESPWSSHKYQINPYCPLILSNRLKLSNDYREVWTTLVLTDEQDRNVESDYSKSEIYDCEAINKTP